ncbi:ABC transporter ATP-binding protein [Heyndrickxia sp. NPDC080065]|uniref:ABC transporter ATP-binding protein n=1 Tax=Heyndrickxia sp. NPDC080065 TaxID=3390568 RepID=UPI003D02B265
MGTVLAFQEVGYWYQSNGKQVRILDKVNFTFERGKFYTIVGPSGSGKTTTLALASALDIPKEGKVLYEGRDIQKIGLEKFRNKNIAIVFQSYNLIPYMTALQNVVTAMDIRKTKAKNKKQKALEMLQKVGLSEEEAQRKVLKLSGGQQQRIAIARALSCDVDIILADEPTGNLDEETAGDIITIFKELASQEGKCIIVVTHSNEVARQSDVIVRLKQKKLNIEEVKLTV